MSKKVKHAIFITGLITLFAAWFFSKPSKMEINHNNYAENSK